VPGYGSVGDFVDRGFLAMYHGVNPEAIGVFGLMMTVIVFGMEQLGIGVHGADHEKVSKSLSLVAFWFGGLAQVFTALVMYLGNPLEKPGMSIFVGTVFANYGLFWLVVAYFFKHGGDKKVLAHFFIVEALISMVFTYTAFKLGLVWPLGTVLALIVALFLVLPFAYYEKSPVFGKIAGAINIAIGICAMPLFLKALTSLLFAAK